MSDHATEQKYIWTPRQLEVDRNDVYTPFGTMCGLRITSKDAEDREKMVKVKVIRVKRPEKGLHEHSLKERESRLGRVMQPTYSDGAAPLQLLVSGWPNSVRYICQGHCSCITLAK